MSTSATIPEQTEADLRASAIEAFRAIRENGPIVIQTDLDFTRPGKRSVRVVSLRGPMGPVRRLVWYVSGRIYEERPVTDAEMRLAREWIAAA